MRTLKKIIAIPVISVLTIMCIFTAGCQVNEEADEVDTTPTTIKVVCDSSDNTTEKQEISKTAHPRKSETSVCIFV